MYSVLVPIWEAPDEPEHFQYVRYLLEDHSLPSVLPSIQFDGNNEGKQPPLYYLLALPFAAGVDLSEADRIRMNPHFTWPGAPDNNVTAVHVLDENWPYHGIFLAAHRIRLLSALLGMVTVALTYRVALAASGSVGIGLFAAALEAVLPGFLYSSASIDNDALANTFSAGLLLITLHAGPARVRRGVLLFGATACLALLAKLTILPSVAAGLTVIGVRAGRGRRLEAAALAVASLSPAIAFWAWRVAGGERNLLGRPPLWPPDLPGIYGPPDWSVPGQFADHMLTSFFGIFDLGSRPLPKAAYVLYCLVFGAGLLAALLGSRCGVKLQRWQATLLWCWPVATLAAIIAAYALASETKVGYDNARLFYPALPAVVTLVASGWAGITSLWPPVRRLLAPSLAFALALAIATPWVIIRPYYPPPWRVSDRLPGMVAPLKSEYFASSIALAGVTLPPGPIAAGSGVYVTFYWRVRRPLASGEWLFVHVVDDRGQKVAAYDGGLASDTLPLTSWRRGDVVQDTHVLTFHTDAASGVYFVKVGWYDPKSGARLELAQGGTETIAGRVQVLGTHHSPTANAGTGR